MTVVGEDLAPKKGRPDLIGTALLVGLRVAIYLMAVSCRYSIGSRSGRDQMSAKTS